MEAERQADSYMAPLGLPCRRQNQWRCCEDGQATLLIYHHSAGRQRGPASRRFEAVCNIAAAWMWEDPTHGQHCRLMTERECLYHVTLTHLQRNQYEKRQGPPPIMYLPGAEQQLQDQQDQQPLQLPPPQPLQAPGVQALEQRIAYLEARLAALEARLDASAAAAVPH